MSKGVKKRNGITLSGPDPLSPVATMGPTDGKGKHHKYPWFELEVGQHFFVPLEATRTYGGAPNLRFVLNMLSKRGKALKSGRKFVALEADEAGKEGVQVWRIK